MRQINLYVKTCSDCPYCQYDSDYGMSYDSGYDCTHDNGIWKTIIISKDYLLKEIDKVLVNRMNYYYTINVVILGFTTFSIENDSPYFCFESDCVPQTDLNIFKIFNLYLIWFFSDIYFYDFMCLKIFKHNHISFQRTFESRIGIQTIGTLYSQKLYIKY